MEESASNALKSPALGNVALFSSFSNPSVKDAGNNHIPGKKLGGPEIPDTRNKVNFHTLYKKYIYD